MIAIFLAIGFVIAILGFGFLVPAVVFRIRNSFALLAMMILFGTAFFLVASNALAYVLPIEPTFGVVMVFIIGVDAILLVRWFWDRFRWKFFQASERTAFILLITFGFLCAFMSTRFVGSDPWSWQHFPLASTIVSGNFPVMSPIDPLSPLRYHYAPAFLAAGFQLLSGISLFWGFAFQPAFGAFGILFTVAAILRLQKTSVRTAVFCALLALAGSGLTWLKVIDWHGFATLWEMISSPITTSPLIFLGHRSTALGFPFMFGLLWCITSVLDRNPHDRRLAYLAGFLFSLALSLSMEMAFVTVSAAAAVTTALLLLTAGTRRYGQRLVIFGLTVLLPAFLISLVQGGVFSGLGSGSGHTFVLHPTFRITINTFGVTAVPWSMQFLRDFGLPLLLFPLAFVGAVRRFRTQPVWMLLAILGLIHFILPFLFEYQLILGEMRRAFYVSTSVFALLAGLSISDFFIASTRQIIRRAGYVFILVMLFPSFLYLALRIVIPTGRLESGPFFAGMPAVTESQKKLYAWVNTNTTQKDFFYVRNLTTHFEGLSEEEVQMRDRILFTTYTGRFTIGPIIFWDYRKNWLEDVLKAEKTCSWESMNTLHVRYLFVPDQERTDWFARTCASSDWILRYDPGASFPRIYELIAADTAR